MIFTEELKKEDIARGLLHVMAMDIAQANHLLAHVCQVNHVFFCGSFAQHPLVQHEIETEWLKRDSMHSTTSAVVVSGLFIIFGLISWH